MIPTLPLRARNRLAETILAALRDGEARRELERLARGAHADEAWLEAGAPEHRRLLRQRARRASEAVGSLPLASRPPTLDETLAAAATLFDAGLGFEVHELLEPHWTHAEGDDRQALQGLIQIAVGYQHLANGNAQGARALLAEGADRLSGRRVGRLGLEAFAHAVRASIEQLPRLDPGAVPPFPRAPGRAR